MLERFFLSAALVGVAMGQSASPREVEYQSMAACPGCASPLFDKGYFIQLKDNPGMPPDGYDLWAPDGSLSYHVEILAPDGTHGRLRDVAIDTDGAAIVAMSYGGYGGMGRIKGGGISIVDPSGKQTQFIATDRWLPAHLCFGPDHSIWVSGTQFAPLREGDHIDRSLSSGYQLVRKYSRDGKMIGEFLPRSTFPPGLSPADAGSIRAAENRIGVLVYPGDLANFPEWIELDLDGRLMGRWKLGPDTAFDRDTI
jgi:hypothetical protein